MQKQLIAPAYRPTTAASGAFVGTLPSDVVAEQYVLSALMLRGPKAWERLDYASEHLTAEDFYLPANGRIFSAINAVHLTGAYLDFVIVRTELRSRGWGDEYGGDDYLLSLNDMAPTSANLPHYIGVVKEKAARRRLIENAAQITGMAFDEESEMATIAAQSEGLILSAVGNSPSAKARWSTVGAAAGRYIEDYNARRKAGNVGLSGVPTYLRDIDKIMAGMDRSCLHILAARPGMGKTAGAFTIGRNVAHHGGTVAAFSLEMSESGISERLISQVAEVDARRMQKSICSTAEQIQIDKAQEYLDNLKMEIDDTSALTIKAMSSRLRRLVARRGALDLVIVDYLQIMKGDSRRSEGDVRLEVQEIAKGLKTLAKEFKVPVLALAQLNRSVEKREDKRPLLSDLAESGQIEAEADTVSFLYRPSYYERRSDEQDAPSSSLPDEVEWIVAKQRNGPTGYVKIGFRPAYTQFVDLEVNRGNF